MPKREPADAPWTPHRQWAEWEREVMAPASTVAPLEIEQATAANGWPMRSWRVETADRIALDAPRWPWSTACAWISALTRAKAEEGAAAFRKWRGRERRNLIGRFDPERTFVNAEAELRAALAAGAVKAWAFQGSRPVTIPAAEWPALEWRRDEHGETLEFDELLLFGEARYRAVTLSRAEVTRQPQWASRDGWAPAEVVQADPPGSGDGASVVEKVEEPVAAAGVPLDFDFVPVAEESPAPEVPLLIPPPTKQERLNAIAREMPAGLRWEVSDPARKPGDPVNYEFHRKLEQAFGSDVSRDDEAREAWSEHYPHKRKAGRPRRSSEK